MPSFRRIAITARSEVEDKEELLNRIVQTLEGVRATVFLDPERCNVSSLKRCKRYRSLKGFDLIVILGGDGTVLRTVQELKDVRTPLLTVNRGRVGFLAEVDVDEVEDILPLLLRGHANIEERQMICCSVQRRKELLHTSCVLNEVVISQGAIARLIDLRTRVHGVTLTDFRADGIIIATPTGSTAYSLAAGGPIVHPTLSAILITPINPYAFSQKPIVIPASEEVEVEISGHRVKFKNIDISLTLDGQIHHRLKHGDRVLIRTHRDRVRFLRRKEDSFYERLRQRLRWGEAT